MYLRKIDLGSQDGQDLVTDWVQGDEDEAGIESYSQIFHGT